MQLPTTALTAKLDPSAPAEALLSCSRRLKRRHSTRIFHFTLKLTESRGHSGWTSASENLSSEAAGACSFYRTILGVLPDSGTENCVKLALQPSHWRDRRSHSLRPQELLGSQCSLIQTCRKCHAVCSSHLRATASIWSA